MTHLLTLRALALGIMTAGMVLAALAGSGPARGEEPPRPAVSSVMAIVACESREAVDRLAELLKVSTRRQPSAGCRLVPPTGLPVYEIIGPVREDADGDVFFILDIGSGFYSIGWPGLNMEGTQSSSA